MTGTHILEFQGRFAVQSTDRLGVARSHSTQTIGPAFTLEPSGNHAARHA
ncbi:MAG: hypothetical protein KC594_07550 [Nitrospira sp.]|nr:hypothetical protein [Nitrospira sp.]